MKVVHFQVVDLKRLSMFYGLYIVILLSVGGYLISEKKRNGYILSAPVFSRS